MPSIDEVDTFGSTATVLALSFTGERAAVYNISVDGNPNYFVGPDGVWVHNCDALYSILAGAKKTNSSAKHSHFVKGGGNAAAEADLHRLAGASPIQTSKDGKAWSVDIAEGRASYYKHSGTHGGPTIKVKQHDGYEVMIRY